MKIILRQLYQLNVFFGFFTKKLRLSNPWNYKVPFLISVPYFLFLIGNNLHKHPFYAILASITIIIGVAGIGYLVNDIGDSKKDALILKQNVTNNLSVLNIIMLLAFFMALVLLPWYYLPFTKKSILLLGIQIFLFCIYSFPPFRLKEKGFWGVITDSLYAHVNPALLAAYTFYLFGYVSFKNFMYLIITLCVWQFVLGIRNIVFHQIKDYGDDIASATNTFVTTFGIVKSISLCKKWLLPVEVITFMIFSVFISNFSLLFIVLIFGYWLFIGLKNKNLLYKINFRDLTYLFLDDLYIKWIPMGVLLILCFKSQYFYPLFILHFFIFRNEIKSYILRSSKLNALISKINYYFLEFLSYKNGTFKYLVKFLISIIFLSGIYFFCQSLMK